MPPITLHTCACDACRCREVVEEQDDLCPDCEVGLCHESIW
jgi:hypothetical protein